MCIRDSLKTGDIEGHIFTMSSGKVHLKPHPTRQPNDICKEVSEPYTRYDSKNYQTTAPILYIQGEVDPATSLSSARYHFQNQAQTPVKKMIVVKEGGHSPFFDEAMAPCRQEILSRVFQRRLNFTDIVDSSGKCQL